MVIVGAKGFAKELLHVFHDNGEEIHLCCFDNVNSDAPDFLYNTIPVIKSLKELEIHFKNNSPEFVVGFGGSSIRKKMCSTLSGIGGKVCRVISKRASLGFYGTRIGDGVIVLGNAIVTTDVLIGDGCIVNKGAIISHDVKIGQYCEISPGAKLLGRVKVGDFTNIGSGAIILPDVVVGTCCRIGAGAVVVKNVQDNSIVAGVPAKPLLNKELL